MKENSEIFSLKSEYPPWFLFKQLTFKKYKIKEQDLIRKVINKFGTNSWKMKLKINDSFLTIDELLNHLQKPIEDYLSAKFGENKNISVLFNFFSFYIKSIFNNEIVNNLTEIFEKLNQQDLSSDLIEELKLLRVPISIINTKNGISIKSGKSFFLSDLLNNNIYLFLNTNIVMQKDSLSVFIIIRSDIKMSKGKIGAQIAHGLISCLYLPHLKS
ncbi:MAG: peptidyl-tRNA hydrolase, partial [Candidatus Thorarchaeota archaeon]